MTRRRFLQGVGGAAVTAAVAGVPIAPAALARYKDRRTNPGWAKAPVAFVLIDEIEPTNLDPSTQNQFDSFHVLRNVYDTLVFANDAANPPALEPRLATSWSSNAAATQWTFNIRPSVKFIDGTNLDASAVALSMNRHREIGAPGLYGYTLDDVTDVTATGPMTVTFTTNRPDPWLPSHMIYFAIMSPTAITDHRTSSDPWAKSFFADNCAGTGAYTLGTWTHGERSHWQRISRGGTALGFQDQLTMSRYSGSPILQRLLN